MSDRTLPCEVTDNLVGWREWVRLPQLGVPAIKAKVDTGARSSSIHAFFIEPYSENGVDMVRFGLHPDRKHPEVELLCRAAVKDHRQVSDSGGHREMRYFIETEIIMGDLKRTIEVNLTNRNNMKFRMLLGRTALAGLAVVPDRSYLKGKIKHSYTKKEPAA